MTNVILTKNNEIIYSNSGLIITETRINYKIKFTIILDNKIINEVICETWDIKEYAEYDNPESLLIIDLLTSTGENILKNIISKYKVK